MEILREIIFDTETTGFAAEGGDRVVEIGCVELLNHTPTGKTFHVYINPEREVPEASFRVHGLSTQFLSDKPKFAEVIDGFLEFVGDAILVAHNAPFDMGFMNAEMKRCGRELIAPERVIDTLVLSRKKNPQMARHNLDTLCKRYDIDNSHRDLHGALLDARLLAEVYIELIGGKIVDFFKADEEKAAPVADNAMADAKEAKPFRAARVFAVNAEELAEHSEFVKGLGDKAVWNRVEEN